MNCDEPERSLSAPAAFKAGFEVAWRWRRVVFSLYVINLIWAVLWSLPLMAALDRLLAGRPAGLNLARHWDLEVLIEIWMDHPEMARIMMSLAAFSLIGYSLLSVLVTAGVAGAAGGKDKDAGLVEVARHAVTGFARVLLLTVVHLVLLAAGSALLWALLKLGVALTQETAPWAAMALRVALVLPALFLLLLIDAAMDYSRIIAVKREEERVSIRRAFVSGWRLLLGRGAAAVWLHLLFGILSLVLVGLLFVLPAGLFAGTGLRLLLGFAVWQVFILVRVMVRVAGLAGQKLYVG